MADRAHRGLPRSARFCIDVPSLIPRENAPAAPSTARCVLSSPLTQRLDFSVSLRGYAWVRSRSARRLAAGDVPVADMLAPLLLDASRRHAGDLANRMLGTFGAGSFHPARNAPLSRRTCKFHNLLAARQVFGDDWMDQFAGTRLKAEPLESAAARTRRLPRTQPPPQPAEPKRSG